MSLPGLRERQKIIRAAAAQLPTHQPNLPTDSAEDPNIETGKELTPREADQYLQTSVNRFTGWTGAASGVASGVKSVASSGTVRTNAQLVDDIGARAGQWAQRSRQQTAFDHLSPQTIGIKQHGYADRLLTRYQDIHGPRGLSTEVRYLNGKEWNRGMPLKGSILLDVVEGSRNAPTAVFDYKFGEAGLTTGRINQIRTGANLLPNIPIIEVRP